MHLYGAIVVRGDDGDGNEEVVVRQFRWCRLVKMVVRRWWRGCGDDIDDGDDVGGGCWRRWIGGDCCGWSGRNKVVGGWPEKERRRK
nr:hypothetical protein [Tanacetum cinerariifolium]